MIKPINDADSFELVEGKDHIEIVVKTIDLGDSETPTTTVAGAGQGTPRQSNRDSFSRRR